LTARNRALPYRRPALPAAVVPLLLIFAAIGYVAGHSSSQKASLSRPGTAVGGNVVLRYPAGWRAAANPVRIPNLAIAQAQAIAPNGNAAAAGLLVGTLPPEKLVPLPARFVEKLRRPPVAEIVNLQEIQAYRYTRLRVPRFGRALTVFVVPARGALPTALACYGPSARSNYMLACERSVAAVTVSGQFQAFQLTPDPDYAREISASISTLDELRVALQRELTPDVSAATAQRLASRLAQRYSTVAAALSRLEPSAGATPVQAALASAITKAREDYEALATAAGDQDAAAYSAAQAEIKRDEADVDQALESFALIGFGTALPSVGKGSAQTG
jgi:hypothetical protein